MIAAAAVHEWRSQAKITDEGMLPMSTITMQQHAA
jgi:hypothetical protein